MPGKPSLYGRMLTARAGGEAIDSHTRDLIARLRAAGVETYDLFAFFGHQARRPEPWYLRRDTHWSGEAAAMAAASVASRLKSLGWVTGGARPYQERRLLVKRSSDIARMTRAPLIEAQFPVEDVACDQVVEAATGAPYRDDPAAPVLVLGDSFLRMYQTDDPGSAGFIAHLARNLRNPVASIVNDGGASTLVRQELVRRPQLLKGKQVVVWEFVERDIRFGMEGWQIVQLPAEPVDGNRAAASYAGARP